MGAKVLPNGLTMKEAKFVKKYIDTGNATEAASQVYDVKSRASARGVALDVIHKPRVIDAIGRAMQKHQLSADYVVSKLKQNIEDGTGVKATARDANTAMDMYFKLTHAYDNGIDQNTYKMTVTKFTDQTLTAELTKVNNKSAQVLNEFGVTK